jgi:hypothetical protein
LPTALDEAFPQAVSFALPFVKAGDEDFVLHQLQEGGQAGKHPAATLRLLGAVLAEGNVFDPQGNAAMLSVIIQALPALRNDPSYLAINDGSRRFFRAREVRFAGSTHELPLASGRKADIGGGDRALRMNRREQVCAEVCTMRPSPS